MQCGIGLCGHCQLGPLLLCRDGPVVAYAGVVAQLLSGAGAVSGAGDAAGGRDAGHARGVEVRLVRRLPAEPARLRGRAAAARRAPCGSRTSPRCRSAVVDGPYDLSLVEGSITTADDAERIQEIRGASRTARDDRGLRDGRRASRGCATSRRRRLRRAPSTPTPSTSPRWRPRRRSPPTSRSTSSSTAVRSTATSCSR